MDELDLLKKDWNTQSTHTPLSAKDIYPMLQKKSSSIVKTLFYIGIAELIFWTLINLVPLFCSPAYNDKLDAIYGNDALFIGLSILSYGVITCFIYLLYRAYTSISVTDNAKTLMANILKTRNIIKYYVLFNLIMVGVSVVIALYFNIHNDPEMAKLFHNLNSNERFSTIAIMGGAIFVFIALIWLFYRLIYGILLKRLHQNYEELKALEE